MTVAQRRYRNRSNPSPNKKETETPLQSNHLPTPQPPRAACTRALPAHHHQQPLPKLSRDRPWSPTSTSAASFWRSPPTGSPEVPSWRASNGRDWRVPPGDTLVKYCRDYGTPSFHSYCCRSDSLFVLAARIEERHFPVAPARIHVHFPHHPHVVCPARRRSHSGSPVRSAEFVSFGSSRGSRTWKQSTEVEWVIGEFIKDEWFCIFSGICKSMECNRFHAPTSGEPY